MSSPSKMIARPALVQWLGLGVALIALGSAVVFDLYLEHARATSREEERLSTQVRVIAENMEVLLSSTNNALENIRKDFPLRGNSIGLKEWSPSHLKAVVNVMPGIRYIGVMDASGTLLASNLPEYVGMNFGSRDYFQAVKQHPNANTLYVSPPFKSAAGPYVINLTRMIVGPRGEFAGAVTASLDPNYFKTLMTSVMYAPDMWSSLAHGDGLLFLMMPEREGVQGKNLARPGSFFTRHRDSGKLSEVLTGTVYATNEVRVMGLYTVQPTSLKMDKPLYVAVGRDLDAVYQTWRRTVLAQTLLFGLIAVVSIIGLNIYQRRMREFDRKAAEAAANLQQSADRLQLASEAAGVGVWDYDLTKGELLWDDSMYTLYGFDRTSVSSSYDVWYNSVQPEDKPSLEAALQATLEQGVPYAVRFRILRGDGALRYIQARARVYFDADGKPVRLIGTNEDITERQQQDAALRESEQRFRSTFDSASIGMALVSLEGRFVQVNAAMCRIVGYTQAELQQKTFQDITHPEDLQGDLALAQELSLGKRDSYQMEKRYFHKDGHVIWVLLSGAAVRDVAGKVLYFIAQVLDITERRTLLEKLELQAHQDYLTGLSSRRHFMEQGEAELARTLRYGNALSLFMLDIDHFKAINDTYGHKVGDIVLQKLSHVMQETLRTVDIIGRMGGEEFAVLLPETDLREAVEVAERLRVIVSGTDVILEAGLALHFTVSIGVVTLQEKDTNLDILLNLADKLLYKAKASGRNKVCAADTLHN